MLNSSWFYDHSKRNYFMESQNITATWTNGITAIPIDFELEIGKNLIKHARKVKYPRGSHTEQRRRFSREKKTDIIIRIIKRANQRKYPFKYMLWDSWYNCS